MAFIRYLQNGLKAAKMPWEYGPASYSVKPKSSVRASNVSSGPKDFRRVGIDLGAVAEVSYVLGHGDYETFLSWYAAQTLMGKAWFFIKLPSGLGFQWVTARFTAPYSAKTLGGRGWTLDFKLELRERALKTYPIPELVIEIPSIAWYLAPGSTTPPLLHDNSETISPNFAPDTLAGALIGFEDQVVEWIFTWEPLDDDESPLTYTDTGTFYVHLPTAWPLGRHEGLLTVQARVDDVLSDRIIISFSLGGLYHSIAWGPEP